jgi:hypothetical protein
MKLIEVTKTLQLKSSAQPGCRKVAVALTLVKTCNRLI